VATLTVLLVLAQAPAATGQAPPPAFTLTNSDATFTLSGVPNAATNLPASITLQAGGGGNPNQGFQSWWWYRLAGDNRESAVNGANVMWTVNNAGNEASANFTLAPNLTATMTWTLLGLGLGKLQLDSTLTLQNTGQQNVTLALFHYLDLDLGGTKGDDSATFALRSGNTVPVITVSDPGWTADYIGDSLNFSAYQSNTFPTVRDLLTNNAVDNFNNQMVNYGPGDWTGGFQWSKTVNAGGTARSRATVVLQPAPEPASVVLMGTGLTLLAIASRSRLRRRPSRA
jgi:hypothetical protein